MACDILVFRISSATYESVLGTGRLLLDSFRSSLTPKLVQVFVYLHDWVLCENLKQPASVKKILIIFHKLQRVLVILVY